jgi:hypothetical protein
MAVATGLCILSSIVIFPESVGHSFRAKFPGVLNPLAIAIGSVEDLFVDSQNTPHSDETTESQDPIGQKRLTDWATKSKIIRTQLLSSLAGLPALRAQQRYLQVDFSYSRLSGDDLRDLFDDLAVLQTRSSGLAFFFDILVSNAGHSHLDSSVYTVRQVIDSRPVTRPGSIHEGHAGEGSTTETHERPHSHHLPDFLRRRSSPAGSHTLRGSHVSLMDHLRRSQQPVGLYESQRYMELEKAFDQ